LQLGILKNKKQLIFRLNPKYFCEYTHTNIERHIQQITKTMLLKAVIGVISAAFISVGYVNNVFDNRDVAVKSSTSA